MQATRYNYSNEEKYGLVEIIGMIKGLSLLMHRMERHFSSGIRRHIYRLVQQFVQVTTRESIRKAVKSKKITTKTYVCFVYLFAWSNCSIAQELMQGAHNVDVTNIHIHCI